MRIKDSVRKMKESEIACQDSKSMRERMWGWYRYQAYSE